MRPLADASAVSLHAFVTDHVEPGASHHRRLAVRLGETRYVHQRRSQRAARTPEDPGELLPAAPDRLTDQAVAAGHAPLGDQLPE